MNGVLRTPSASRYGLAMAFVPLAVWAVFLFPPFGLSLYSSDLLYFVLVVPLMFFAVLLTEKLLLGDWSVLRLNASLPLALFIGLALFSLSYAEHVLQGIRELAKIILSVLLFICLVEVCNTMGRFKALLRPIVWFGCALSLHGTLFVVAIGLLDLAAKGQIEAIDGYASGFNFRIFTYDLFGVPGFATRPEDFIAIGAYRIPRNSSVFFEPGYFANFLELSIFATVAYYFANKKPPLLLVVLFVQIFAFVLTFSVGGWIVLAAALVASLAIASRLRVAKFMRIAITSLLSALLALAVVNWAWPNVVSRLLSDVLVEKFISDEFLVSGAMRLISFQLGLESVFERPWLGLGIGQVTNLQPPGFGEDVLYGANNALLSASIELGMIGLVLFAWLLMSIAVTMKRVVTDALRAKREESIGIAAAVVGGAVSLIGHSMIVETKWVPFFWVGVALLYIYSRLLQRSAYSDAYSPDVRLIKAP